MLSNNIAKVLTMIPLFNREGTQNILDINHARDVVAMIDKKDLANPNTTYQDVQCGTGFIMLVLAEALMESLKPAIPEEVDRLAHIFGNQLFLSDFDNTQYRIARANLLRAIGTRDFEVNVECIDCFKVTRNTTYTISGIDFDTTNEFVPYYKKLSKDVIVVTRANKHSYEGKKINEISTYRFLGIAQTSVPICIMHFEADKKKKGVKFTNGQTTVTVEQPTFLPGKDLTGYLYGEEVLGLKLSGFKASYGSISREKANTNKGNVPIIFGAGEKDSGFGETIKVSKKIVTAREGVGKHKLVVSKNGNRGQKSLIKYADPTYGVGYTALWVEVKDEAEFNKINKIWETEPCYDKLIKILKETSPANGIEFWTLVPEMKHLKQVKAIYEQHYS